MKEREYRQVFEGYRAPTAVTKPKYERMTELTKQMAKEIWDLVPASYERDRALRDLQAVRMWANAGIACYTKPEAAE